MLLSIISYGFVRIQLFNVLYDHQQKFMSDVYSTLC